VATKKLQGQLDYLAMSLAFHLVVMKTNRGNRPGWLGQMMG
jgi:hypothetical protein